MEGLKVLMENANRQIRAADHLAYTTYPMIQDPKLIMKIAGNVRDAMKNAIEAIVFYDRLYKRVNPLGEGFTSKYDVFRDHCAKRYSIPTEHLLAFEDLSRILREHKESPTSFCKGDAVVICSENYRQVRSISLDKVKSFLNVGKQFVVKANQIIK